MQEISSRVQRDLRLIGSKIKSFREGQRLTQQEFANELGVSLSWISRLETGKTNPKLSQILHILNVYQLDIKDIFP